MSETLADQLISLAGNFLMMATIIGILWKWFLRDRWEAAVEKVVTSTVLDAHDSAEKMSLKVEELGVSVNGHLSRVESLERKIENGLTDRLHRVEQNSEELIKGVARIEGIIQMLVRPRE